MISVIISPERTFHGGDILSRHRTSQLEGKSFFCVVLSSLPATLICRGHVLDKSSMNRRSIRLLNLNRLFFNEFNACIL